MSWSVWWPLFGAAAAGTVLAVTFYIHWSYRYTKRMLGLVSEVAALLLIVCAGGAAIAALLTNTPR